MTTDTVPQGSGAVESAIRRVINLRIKGASIYWLPESVDAILLLRSAAVHLENVYREPPPYSAR